jgi:transposase-like protein
MRALMRGLTDAEFERRYGQEEQCLVALMASRVQAGMSCPACGHGRSYLCGRRVGCTRCNRRWSVTAGTVMAHTKLPLATWFRAMHAMSSTKQAISAVELGRRLGVSYPTAWYLHKRLRHAMTERESRYVVGGPGTDGSAPVVEADDVYLGGERNQGSGPAGKTRVIAAAERHPRGRMGRVAMQVVSGFTAAAVRSCAYRRAARLQRFRRGRPKPSAHHHREQAPVTRTHQRVLRAQHRHRQPQHSHQGHPQGDLGQAYPRLSRRLLLDHKPATRHGRHGPGTLPRHRNINQPDTAKRLRNRYRANWLISGKSFCFGRFKFRSEHSLEWAVGFGWRASPSAWQIPLPAWRSPASFAAGR